MDEVAPGTLLESILSLSVHMGEIAGFGSTERRTGYALNRADMPAPQTNGMFVHGPEEDHALRDMPELRVVFADEGRPFGVVTIDGRTPTVEAAAEEVGLCEMSTDVAMALPRSAFRPAPPVSLRIERVPPSDMTRWVEIAAAGFGLPTSYFESIVSPSLLAILDEPWIGSVIGWLGDVPVSTATYVVHEAGTAIFSVATPPEHRGNGYATALTSDVVARGFDVGASFAWLEASPMGLGLYERLGFRRAWTVRCRAEPDGDAYQPISPV